MSKLSSITEDKYTLNDIFAKNYQIWAFIPLLLYLLTPVVHMIVFGSIGKYYFDNMSFDQGIHYMKTGELPGDYYMSIIQYAFFIGAVLTVVAILSRISARKMHSLKRMPDGIPTLFFIVYLAMIVISSFVVNHIGANYFWGFTVRAEGVISFFCYYLVYYLCGSFISKEKYKKILIYFFLLISVIIAVLTIIDEYFTDVLVIGEYPYPCGIFYTHNFYAYFLAIAIMLSSTLAVFSKTKAIKVLSFLTFALNTYVLAINDSLGGFLACIVAFIFVIVFVLIRDKKFSFKLLAMFAVFLAIIFVAGLFTPSFFSELTGLVRDVEKIATNAEDADKAGTSRWVLWTHTWQYIKEKPWFGWGFEGTAERLGTETHADKAHNEYLENMAYYGIPAGLIYIGALISVYIKALKRRKHVDDITLVCLAGALGYIGSALVGNSFIFTAPFCFIFLGLGNQTIEDYAEPAPVAPDEGEEDDAEATCECLQDGPEKITVDNGAETGDNKRASEETEVTE